MEFSADKLERAVWQFHQSDHIIQEQAHEWLKEAKNSPEAWAFVWDLLQPQKTTEVQFFAASTLHTKIKKCLNELSHENMKALRDRLLASIMANSAGPKIILNRLCMSLSVYLIQTCPEKWPDALPSLLLTFTSENLPQIPVDRMLWVLCEILIVLPEELSCMQILQHHKNLLKNHLVEHTPSVVSLLEKILTSNTDQEVIMQAIKCTSSWITIRIPITEYQNLPHILVDLVFTAHKHHAGICEKALESLRVIVDQPENYKYPTYLLGVFKKILPLEEIIANEILLGKSADQELISNIYNLFLTFGSTHSRLCLNWIKQGGDARNQVMTLIMSILKCSGAKGTYPTEETYSRLAFGFWYILQDEITFSPLQERELFMKFLGPIYKELVNALITKAQIPDSDQNFSAEDLESFRCYRQDISDTMMYCQSILRKTTIRLIQAKLEKVNVNETKWQELEACLFSLCSISENVDVEENEFLPTLFQYIRNLPFQNLDPKVLSTALDTIGAYANWISAHSGTLEYVLPLIILGLNVPETTSSATMALKDLARDCQYDIKKYSSLILDATQKALHGGRLKPTDSQRVMCTIGILLSVQPWDTIMHYLNLILTPYMDQLNSLAVQQSSPQVRTNIILCLKIVGVLCASLNTKLETNSDNVPVSSQPPSTEPQPVLIILHKLLPAIKLIATAWFSDAQVMQDRLLDFDQCLIVRLYIKSFQSLFAVLKHSVKTLHEDVYSAVTDILDLIVSIYRIRPQPAALDLSNMLCSLFGKDDKFEDMMQSLTNELCSITMTKLSSAQNLSDHTDLIEALFTYLGQIIKRIPKLVVSADPVSLFQCATITLAIPELPTVKSASCFLVNFINQSPDFENFTNVINTYGQQLVLQIVSCIAGEASRSNIEPLAQILLALNKNYCENLSRWLRQVVNENVCPRTTAQQRDNFISALLMQRGKTVLQETVRKFSLMCRGIIGTEYAQSLASFNSAWSAKRELN